MQRVHMHVYTKQEIFGQFLDFEDPFFYSKFDFHLLRILFTFLEKKLSENNFYRLDDRKPQAVAWGELLPSVSEFLY